MKTIKFIGALALTLLAPLASAQATRTWVSGVGDDANPCSRTAPCKTFAGAISKTAAGGEINAIDPGSYGAVTITKSITIDGGGTMASVLASGTNGIVINAGATDRVILRNLDINGSSTGLSGIRFLAGKQLIIENTKIHQFTQNGILVAPSTGNSTLLTNTVTISQITDSGSTTGTAIRIVPGSSATADAMITNTIVDNNDRGIIVEGGGTASISGSMSSSNLHAGIGALGNARSAIIDVDNTASIGNSAGIRALAATIYLARSTVTGNSIGLEPTGGTIVSFGNNRVMANVTDGSPSSTTPMK